MFKRILEAEDDVKISPPTDTLIEKKIIFKPFCIEEKKITNMEQNKIEKCLAPIWSDIMSREGRNTAP